MTPLKRSRFIALTGAAATAPRPARAQSPEKFQFTGVPTDDMTPIYWALTNGAYRKAGLDVEIAPSSAGAAATAAVLSGTYDMGKTSSVAALLAYVKGLPIVIVGHGVLWETKKPFTRTLVASDSTIKTATDVAGKVFATASLNDLSTLGVYAWVDKHGGDVKSIKWVEMPNSALATALFEHRIDACTLNEPAVTAALQTGKARVLCDGFASIADRFPDGVYIVRRDYAATHMATIRTWLRVTYDATRYTNTHKSETVAMMSEITKIPPDIFKTMVRVDNGTASDPAMLQPVIDAAAKFNFLPRAFPAKDAYLPNLGL